MYNVAIHVSFLYLVFNNYGTYMQNCELPYQGAGREGEIRCMFVRMVRVMDYQTTKNTMR